MSVPASIDASGTGDAGPALTSFLRSVPDGSVVDFPAAATYRIDAALRLGDRHDLVLDGHGTTLRMGSDDWTQASSLIDLYGTSSDIVLRDLVLVGASPTPGVLIDGHEFAMAVNVDNAKRIELDRLTVRGVYGDALTVDSWASDIWFHDSYVVSAGRNGVAILAARDVLAERDTFDKTGLHPFDVEPYQATGGGIGITFRDNIIDRYGDAGPGAARFAVMFAVGGPAGATIADVTVTGNTVLHASIGAKVAALARVRDLTVVDNASLVDRSPRDSDAPVLWFERVDGLTVAGNVQPRSRGELVSVTDSTGVSVE